MADQPTRPRRPWSWFVLDVTKMERPERSGMLAVVVFLSAIYSLSTWPPGDCQRFPSCLIPRIPTSAVRIEKPREFTRTRLVPVPLWSRTGRGSGPKQRCEWELEVRPHSGSATQRYPIPDMVCPKEQLLTSPSIIFSDSGLFFGHGEWKRPESVPILYFGRGQKIHLLLYVDNGVPKEDIEIYADSEWRIAPRAKKENAHE